MGLAKKGPWALKVLAAICGGVVSVAGLALLLHARGVAAVDARYAGGHPARLPHIGTTNTLRILPLLDWHTSSPQLMTDMGVSYLIETDGFALLFDTGTNTGGASPAPLEHNMRALGVGLSHLNGVFISHAHFDHIGGRKWSGGGLSGSTFGIGNAQPSLSHARIFTPIPMDYPGSTITVTPNPTQLAPGVATTGTIPRKLFGGLIDEQALVVNVQGRGLVVVVGCGHQTVTRLVERVEAVFEQPIYGVVGGLHFPIPQGHLSPLGFNVLRYFGSGSGPLSPLSMEDVRAEMELLKARRLGLIAVGGHDSSDEVIEEFRAAFGAAHRYLKVGSAIEVAGVSPAGP